MGDQVSFGQWLKQRRRELDLTRDELAHRAGCSAETTRKIEEGIRRPSRQLAELIAASVDIPAEDQRTLVQWARAPGVGASSGVRGQGDNGGQSEHGEHLQTIPIGAR